MEDNRRRWSPPQIIWSAIAGTVIWTAVGFSWFGHGFNWTTERRASEMTESAVAESLSAICVAQARGAPNAEAALEEFNGLSSWKQGEFVEKERWAIMPGSDSSVGSVVAACVTKLRQA